MPAKFQENPIVKTLIKNNENYHKITISIKDIPLTPEDLEDIRDWIQSEKRAVIAMEFVNCGLGKTALAEQAAIPVPSTEESSKDSLEKLEIISTLLTVESPKNSLEKQKIISVFPTEQTSENSQQEKNMLEILLEQPKKKNTNLDVSSKLTTSQPKPVIQEGANLKKIQEFPQEQEIDLDILYRLVNKQENLAVFKLEKHTLNEEEILNILGSFSEKRFALSELHLTDTLLSEKILSALDVILSRHTVHTLKFNIKGIDDIQKTWKDKKFGDIHFLEIYGRKITEEEFDFFLGCFPHITTIRSLQNEENKLNRGYIRLAVDPNGDCGYTAFGITRQDAYQLIKDELPTVQDLLKPVIKEALYTESFINHLKNNQLASPSLIQAFNNYQHAAWEGGNIDQNILNVLEKHTKDLTVVNAYIDYDIRDKKVDLGWTHPCILQALAHIQKIELWLWGLGDKEVLIPHKLYDQDYSIYKPTEVKNRVDLLFIKNNHFERLEFVEYDKTFPAKNETIYPSDSPLDQKIWRNWTGITLERNKLSQKKIKEVLVGESFRLHQALGLIKEPASKDFDMEWFRLLLGEPLRFSEAEVEFGTIDSDLGDQSICCNAEEGILKTIIDTIDNSKLTKVVHDNNKTEQIKLEELKKILNIRLTKDNESTLRTIEEKAPTLVRYVEDDKVIDIPAGCNVYLMSELPKKALLAYTDSYIWLKDAKKLYYIDQDQSQEVFLKNIILFESVIKKDNKEGKLCLSYKELMTSITLNGGHTLPEKHPLRYPEKYKARLQLKTKLLFESYFEQIKQSLDLNQLSRDYKKRLSYVSKTQRLLNNMAIKNLNKSEKAKRDMNNFTFLWQDRRYKRTLPPEYLVYCDEIEKDFLAEPININAEIGDHKTLLEMAYELDNPDIVAYLLVHGADPFTTYTDKDPIFLALLKEEASKESQTKKVSNELVLKHIKSHKFTELWPHISQRLHPDDVQELEKIKQHLNEYLGDLVIWVRKPKIQQLLSLKSHSPDRLGELHQHFRLVKKASDMSYLWTALVEMITLSENAKKGFWPFTKKSALHDEVHNLAEEFKTGLEKKYHLMQIENKSLKDRLAESDRKIKKLEEALEKQEKENKQLIIEMQEVKKDNERLRRQLEESEKKNQRTSKHAEEKHTELEEDHKQLKEDHKQLKEEFSEFKKLFFENIRGQNQKPESKSSENSAPTHPKPIPQQSKTSAKPANTTSDTASPQVEYVEMNTVRKGFIDLENDHLDEHVFGIPNEKMLTLLLTQLPSESTIQALLAPAVNEALLSEVFYGYLIKKQAIDSNVSHERIKLTSKQYVSNARILQCYLKYHIKEKKSEPRMMHPSILQALAHIQKVDLYLWQCNEMEELIPYSIEQQSFAVYHAPNANQVVHLQYENNQFKQIKPPQISGKDEIHRPEDQKGYGFAH